MTCFPEPRSASRLAATLLCFALLSGASGCSSVSKWWNPTSGYEPRGNPQLDFEQAKALCEKESEFRGANGTTNTDWTKFESCMKTHDWVRP